MFHSTSVNPFYYWPSVAKVNHHLHQRLARHNRHRLLFPLAEGSAKEDSCTVIDAVKSHVKKTNDQDETACTFSCGFVGLRRVIRSLTGTSCDIVWSRHYWLVPELHSCTVRVRDGQPVEGERNDWELSNEDDFSEECWRVLFVDNTKCRLSERSCLTVGLKPASA